MERLEDEKSKNPIQVADRIFQVLESLARGGPAGLMELSNTLGLHKSTVHRLLNSLIYMGYVRQDESRRPRGLRKTKNLLNTSVAK